MKIILAGKTVSVRVYRFKTKRAAEVAHAIIYHGLRTIMEDDGLTIAQIREALKKARP